MNACTNPGCDHGTSPDGACIMVPDANTSPETFHCLYCSCNSWRFNSQDVRKRAKAQAEVEFNAGQTIVIDSKGLLASPHWPEVLPYVQMQVYGRDNGPDHPRCRFEVNAPLNLLQRFAEFTTLCPHCGAVMKFVRPRNKSKSARNPSRSPSPTGRYYLAVSCPLDVNTGCSRSAAAAAEYERLEHIIKARSRAETEVVLSKKPAQETLDLFPPCPLKSFAELQTALRNIKYDITCGGCAELFFTGHVGATHDVSCTTGKEI